METPLSSRRVTRSQTLASANSSNLPLSKKVEDSEKTMAKSRKNKQQDRSALIDITNDSPIVGLAMGSLKTPSSAMSKKRMNGPQFARTPGSGEALLRGQVKTLLQKVEEEAEISKITLEKRPFFNLVNSSPMNLVGPTPANTPYVFNLYENNDDVPSLTPVTEKFLIPQMMIEKKQEMDDSDTLITRSLLLDFSEKSDASDCSSVLTYQKEKDDDDASIWSIQVNASSTKDEDEEEVFEDHEDSLEDGDEYYCYGEGGDDLDDLCEEMSKISVEEPIFEGKHIRFVYNSDDEIEKEQVLGVLRLKGLPTPKGKHLRFPEDL